MKSNEPRGLGKPEIDKRFRQNKTSLQGKWISFFPSLLFETSVCVNNLDTTLRRVFGTKNDNFFPKSIIFQKFRLLAF